MSLPLKRLAFLSTDSVDTASIDDRHALPALKDLGVHVDSRSWRDSRVDWAAYDGVIVRSTWDYHLEPEAFFSALTRIDGHVPLANSLPLMRWNGTKSYLRDLECAGVSIVPTEFGDSLDGPRLDTLTSRLDNVIIKPAVGASASGVFRLTGAPDAETRRAVLGHYATRAFLAQPFVPSVLDPGEVSVFVFDGQIGHTILKTPAPHDFRVQEEYGGRITATTPTRAMLDTTQAALSALPEPCLYARVDLVALENGSMAVMEVELIEPALYLRVVPSAPTNFARAVRRWLDATGDQQRAR